MKDVPENNIYPADTPAADYRYALVRCGCCKTFVEICTPVNDFYRVAGYPHLVCLPCMLIIHDKNKNLLEG